VWRRRAGGKEEGGEGGGARCCKSFRPSKVFLGYLADIQIWLEYGDHAPFSPGRERDPATLLLSTAGGLLGWAR
jgi:hypothetical protein